MQVTDSAQNGATKELRERLMQEDADLTSQERSQIRAKLEEIANSGQWWMITLRSITLEYQQLLINPVM